MGYNNRNGIVFVLRYCVSVSHFDIKQLCVVNVVVISLCFAVVYNLNCNRNIVTNDKKLKENYKNESLILLLKRL